MRASTKHQDYTDSPKQHNTQNTISDATTTPTHWHTEPTIISISRVYYYVARWCPSFHHLMTHHLMSVCCRRTDIYQYDTVASAPIPNMHTTCVLKATYVLAGCIPSRPIYLPECTRRECNHNNKQIGTCCDYDQGSQHPIIANWLHARSYSKI